MKHRRQQLESGQGFTEYALILALVSIASIFVLNALFGVMQDNFVAVLCEMRDLGRGETNCNFQDGQIVEEDLTDDPLAPTAVINFTCDTVGNCEFDPLLSFDDNDTPLDTSDDGTITDYEFLFSPNTVLTYTAANIAANVPVTHTFTTSPAYAILRVTDDDELTDTASVLVEFSSTNQAPLVDYFRTGTGGAGATYIFDPKLTSAGISDGGLEATRDPDGDLSEIKWEIYNTATDARVRLERYLYPNATQNLSHVFSQPGNYRIVVTATDRESPAQSTTVVRYLPVTGSGTNTPPSIARLGIIDDDGNFCGSGACFCSKEAATPSIATCRVVAEISDDDVLSPFDINFTVSTTLGGTSPAQSANSSGEINIGGNTYWYTDFDLDVSESGNTYTLNVSASDGTNTSTGTASMDIVMNQAPSVSPIVKVSGSGNTITVEATATDADSDDLSFTWSYDDDATGGTESPGPIYSNVASDPTIPVTSQATINFINSIALPREVKLIVSDGVVTETVSAFFTIGNDSPVMQSLTVNEVSDPLVQFTAVASDTEDGILTTYCWSFGSTDLDSDKTTTQQPICINDNTPFVGYCLTGTYTVSVYAKDSTGQASNTLTLSPNLVISNSNAATGCGGSTGPSAVAGLDVTCNLVDFDCNVDSDSAGDVDTSTLEFFANGSGIPFATGPGPHVYDGTNTDPVTFRIEFDDSNGNPYFAEVVEAPQGLWIETSTSTTSNGNPREMTVTVTVYQQSDSTSDGVAIDGNVTPVTVSATNIYERKNESTTNAGPSDLECDITTGSSCTFTWTEQNSDSKYIDFNLTLTNLPPGYSIDTPKSITSDTETGF